MSKQASGMVLMTPKLTNAEAKASMKVRTPPSVIAYRFSL